MHHRTAQSESMLDKRCHLGETEDQLNDRAGLQQSTEKKKKHTKKGNTQEKNTTKMDRHSIKKFVTTVDVKRERQRKRERNRMQLVISKEHRQGNVWK